MEEIKVYKEDLMYLLCMYAGYIDDDLGGLEEDSEYTKKLKELCSKYKIPFETILTNFSN